MYEESTQRIVALMKETFGSQFKEVYDGDPDEIPLFNLPCLVVDQTNDNTVKAAFGQDDVTDSLIIKVIYNKADDWANNVDPNDLTSRKIRRIVAARDPETGDYLPGTIKHALRHYATEGITAIGGDVAIEYGIVPRTYGDEGLLTQEGWVRFTITYSVDANEEP